MTQLIPTSFIANNASLKAFDIDGLLHPVKPITQLIPLSIFNLEKNQVKRIVLQDFISFDLACTSFRADLSEDDDSSLQGTQSSNSNIRASIDLQIIGQGKVTEHLRFSFGSYPSILFNPLILEHQKTFDIRADKDINRLTFFCEPVYLLTGATRKSWFFDSGDRDLI